MDNTIVVAVKAVVVNKGRILIMKRADTDASGAGLWETVGGKINFGEELEDALIRETQEESGLVIRVEKLLYVATFMTTPHRQMVIITYLSRTDQEDVLVSDEHSEYLWANTSQLEQLLPASTYADFVKYNVIGECIKMA